MRDLTSSRKGIENDPYGLAIAWENRVKAAQLLEKIKTEGIKENLITRAMAFVPNDYPFKTTATIYFVLTGTESGDAYVREVSQSNDKYRIVDGGTPTIVINLSLFAKLYVTLRLNNSL